jgi:hypothetical protein
MLVTIILLLQIDIFLLVAQPYTFPNPLDHAQVKPFPLSTLSTFTMERGNPSVEGS